MVERSHVMPLEAHDTATTTRTNALFQLERRERIMELVLREGRVDVTDLAGTFDVTTETIRRDLTDLQQDRLVRRVHGGAVPWRSWIFEPKLEVRGGQNVEEKRRIAQAALSAVPERGSILVDSGSTTSHFADLLGDRELTVITNSIPIVQSLAQAELSDVMVIGGTLRRNTMAFVDEAGVDMLRDVTVDVLFMGCDGASPERGFTTPYRSEVAIKQAMMASARRIVMMFDHSKVGNDQLLRFAPIEDVDLIFTGVETDDAMASLLQEQGPIVTRV
jgi:DeoR family fructose operon transcriptional repressor